MYCRRSSRIKHKTQIDIITVASKVISKGSRKNILKRSADETPSIIEKPLLSKRRKAKNSPTPKAELANLKSNYSNDENISCPTKRPVSLKRKSTCLSDAENQKSLSNNDSSSQSSLPSAIPVLELNCKNTIDEAIEFLIKVEPKLKPIILKNPCDLFSPQNLKQKMEPFETLSSSIISQQVSTAAAKSIKTRFVALFNPKSPDPNTHAFPSPSQICATSIEIIRAAGLSQRKAEYLKGLAENFNNGELSSEMLLNAPYEDVFDALIKVRGLGRWSIEMFACFGLKKLDVFSTQDLGVQRGMALLLGKDVDKLKKNSGKWKYMSEKEMEDIANKFKPYRSVFMWYTWRVQESFCSALELEK